MTLQPVAAVQQPIDEFWKCKIRGSLAHSGDRCHHCGQRGATLGCRVERCKLSYHLPCARLAHATFYDVSFLIACSKHAALFRQEQTPQRLCACLNRHWGSCMSNMSQRGMPHCLMQATASITSAPVSVASMMHILRGSHPAIACQQSSHSPANCNT